MAVSSDSQVIVISGANRGIGLELARQALARGHHVIAGARNPKESRGLQELRDSHPSSAARVHVLELDITSEDNIGRFVRELKNIGVDHIDVLINNAGVYSDDDGRATEVIPLVVLQTFETNAVGPIRLTQALLPFLRRSRQPRIANTASLMGSITDNSSGGSLAYRMSKTAVNMFTKTLAIEEPGLAVIALHPGWVKTDMGGANAPVSVSESAEGLLNIILRAKPTESGKFFNYDGRELPW